MAATGTWRSILFIDLDNTLLRGPFESAVFPLACRQIAAQCGLSLEEIRDLILAENAQRQQDPTLSAAAVMDWEEILHVVAAVLGTTLDLDVVEIVRRHAHPPFAACLDDAATVLAALQSPRRALVAATNGLARFQVPVLEGLGLLPYFDAVLTPDRMQALKRERTFYGSWPQRAALSIHVGDRYDDDVASPHGFGFRTVWKQPLPNPTIHALDPFSRPSAFDYTNQQSVHPDAIIGSLAELPAVVSTLEQAD